MTSRAFDFAASVRRKVPKNYHLSFHYNYNYNYNYNNRLTKGSSCCSKFASVDANRHLRECYHTDTVETDKCRVGRERRESAQ